MTKKDLIDKIADGGRTLNKSQARKLIEAFVNCLEKELSCGNRIILPGFGSFQVVARAPRICRNPQTGEKMKIPAKKAVKFRASKSFTDRIQP